MWMPTHVQVTVHRAEGILVKGKNNTNDCFVTIALGKTKYRTSVKENAPRQVEWHEECELPIPDQGNTAEIVLTALHQNFIGVDQFLGRVCIPLNTLDIYERPKNKWYTLESKPGKEGKKKDRGRLEVKIGFTVRSGSLTNLNKPEKSKSSLSVVAQSVGGSLLSLGSAEKRKGIKKFAKSIGSKMHLKGKKKNGNSEDEGSSIGSVSSLQIRNANMKFKSKQTAEDADPGVVSDEDEFAFEELSHKSSASSINQPTNTRTVPSINVQSGDPPVSDTVQIQVPPPKPPREKEERKPEDEWESKLLGNKTKSMLRPRSSESLNRRSWDYSKLGSHIEEEIDSTEVPLNKHETIHVKTENKSPQTPKKHEREGMFAKFKPFRKEKSEQNTEHGTHNSSERIIIGGENETKPAQHHHISNELLQKFEGKTREDLILALCETQSDLEKQMKKLRDLEDYIDDLLLRVMETTPKILQNPYIDYTQFKDARIKPPYPYHY